MSCILQDIDAKNHLSTLGTRTTINRQDEPTSSELL